MKLVLAAVALTCLSVSTFADESRYNLLESNPLDFSAPVVYSKTNVTEAPAGTIVYDVNSGAFYGLTSGGNPSSAGSWLQLGASTTSGSPNVTSNSAGNEHIERVTVTSVCSSSPCTITRQSGSWLTSITRTGTGNYTLNITTNEFSAAPTCTCSAGGAGADTWCEFLGSTATNTTATINTRNSSGVLTDADFSVICMGPH